MKICPVGAQLFHADGRLELSKLIIAFPNFGKVTKKGRSKTLRCSLRVTKKQDKSVYIHSSQ